ncbi:MAG TPA: transcriptional regulator NrdR [Herpetosiphon sp.]|uniref:Transcriptional repressor NrdR n=1 Tax=Herpetosiphon aurantiacus (strain ATCC 23779 / DSM 785 / 114-95) TaxID=316274 RepID=NRDR_HERA2|nr:transcriptional regulator NrdR [Herpetosiphon sp.]A9B4R2.1 RecName: Full=Transcriptional repressor NrdR [Herpetosiphon aurantiacus DSM 785]ABX04227.1 ATP-cone domain protein [Herpetosiphon aurantiacus DSM 785]HBW51378.1 transcriptional regulator NrdR [Herpetosiphon sp.]
MRCPYCTGESAVIDTRELDNGETIRRRRRCKHCDRRFTTYERVESVNVMVVKKNGDREPYDREKLLRGLRVAAYKRPISADVIDTLVTEVEAALIAYDALEVPSSVIGEQVMERLRSLDEVAYIRFASVYRSFSDLGKLREAVEELMEKE